jgi:hypothetical protein
MRRRIAIAGPSALLCLIAGAQMILASTAGLSPWKGGGFGMFASIDGVPFRWVRLYVHAAERSEEIALPASLEDAADRVAAWPHRRAMDALAHAVAARERRHGRPVERVRIEVWRADISPALDVSERLVRELTVDTHAAEPRGADSARRRRSPDRRMDAAAPDARHPPAAAAR